MDSKWEREMATGKKNHRGEAEDEAAKQSKIDSDGVAELHRRLEEEENSDGKKMEVEEFGEREVVKKRIGECEARKVDSAAEERKRRLEEYEWRRRKEEQMVPPDPEMLTDYYAYEARSFEQSWNDIYANANWHWVYGSFHDTTEIPCMRFTYNRAPDGGRTCGTLQVFSVKVAELSGELQWPINVFGTIALRDSLDQNRNIIFDRNRDHCQTLTEKDPYLKLTGPVRAVVLYGPVVFQVSLNVRGPSKSEDKEISLLAVPFRSDNFSSRSILINECYTSRLTTLEFALGHIVYSVEATVSIQVIYGSWPGGFCGQFAARTASINKEVLLLDSGDEKHLITDEIKLSRRVASVESHGILIVSVESFQDGNVLKDEIIFTPQEMGTHSETLTIW